MEHDLVLEGKVVGPSGFAEKEVGVTDGHIAEIVKHGLKGERRIRAGRCLIFPGFVDIHVHLREPGWERKEDFRTGTEAAVHGGVTTVVDMPNNPSPSINVHALEEKRRLAAAKARVDVRFYGGVLGGSLDEIGRIAKLVVGYKIYLAKTTGGLIFPEEELCEAFNLIQKTGLPVSVHCEEQAIIERRAWELRGETRKDVYADIRSPEAEIESVGRVVAALRNSTAPKANICHTTTEGALGLVEQATRGGMSMHCEAALLHLFYNRKALLQNPLLKTNPPLRSEEDREALVRSLNGGIVSFLVTDHAPHALDEKESEGLSGVPGLDDYSHVVSWLIRGQEVEPSAIGKVASANPAKFAGLDDRGEIDVGKRADFTILDLHSPDRVKSDDVRSKCGWSPYEGVEFPGRARWTVSRGEVLMDDFELVT